MVAGVQAGALAAPSTSACARSSDTMRPGGHCSDASRPERKNDVQDKHNK